MPNERVSPRKKSKTGKKEGRGNPAETNISKVHPKEGKEEKIVWIDEVVWRKCPLRLLPEDHPDRMARVEKEGERAVVEFPYKDIGYDHNTRPPPGYDSIETIADLENKKTEDRKKKKKPMMLGMVHGIWCNVTDYNLDRRHDPKILRIFLSWKGIDPLTLRSWRPGWYDWSVMTSSEKFTITTYLMDDKEMMDDFIAKAFASITRQGAFWKKYYNEETDRRGLDVGGWIGQPFHMSAHKDGFLHSESDDEQSVFYERCNCLQGWKYVKNTDWKEEEEVGEYTIGES